MPTHLIGVPSRKEPGGPRLSPLLHESRDPPRACSSRPAFAPAVTRMKRSACPSTLAGGKKPFIVPRPSGAVASGDVRPPARRAAGAALALVKVHASEEPTREGSSEPAQLCGPPRTPLATIAPGEKASVSTRKPFKPPVSKDSEMSEMYGNSDKVRQAPHPSAPAPPHHVRRSPPRSASEADRRSPACRGTRRTSRTLSCSTRRLRRPAPRTSSPSAQRDPCPVPLPSPPQPPPPAPSPPGPAPRASAPRPAPRVPSPPHVFPTRVPHAGVAHGCRAACRCAASARCTWCSTRSSASS